MAFIEDVLKGGNIVTGLAIGAGLTLLMRVLPGVATTAGAVVRPVAKLAIGTGVAVYETARTVVAQGGEVVSDLVAEVQHERQPAARDVGAPTSPREVGQPDMTPPKRPAETVGV